MEVHSRGLALTVTLGAMLVTKEELESSGVEELSSLVDDSYDWSDRYAQCCNSGTFILGANQCFSTELKAASEGGNPCLVL